MKRNLISLGIGLLALTGICSPAMVSARDSRESEEAQAKESKAAFIKTDPGLSNHFKDAYGYVIFPNIGKGALGVGAAGGQGVVYEKQIPVGKAKMTQVTVGAQAGGQAYREVIFFENKEALDRFKDNKLEFSGQMSAVAAKAGASANAKYTDGVLIFTEERAGLMLEASIGGQKFTYEPY
jgi:lipid-binding SYLF domain-containing protein